MAADILGLLEAIQSILVNDNGVTALVSSSNINIWNSNQINDAKPSISIAPLLKNDSKIMPSKRRENVEIQITIMENAVNGNNVILDTATAVEEALYLPANSNLTVSGDSVRFIDGGNTGYDNSIQASTKAVIITAKYNYDNDI